MIISIYCTNTHKNRALAQNFFSIMSHRIANTHSVKLLNLTKRCATKLNEKTKEKKNQQQQQIQTETN